MQILAASDIAAAMDYSGLTRALGEAFRSHYVTPVRHHHTISLPDQADATLLLMPSWTNAEEVGTSLGGFVGIKMVSVFPDNEARLGKASILGAYLLLDQQSGEILALMDGPSLTVWRTACASALAADYLAKSDADNLLMIGTGALSEHLIRAHAAIRPIRKIRIWGRSGAKAARLAESISDLGLDIDVTEDRAGAVADADIISCATMSSIPLVEGTWLKPGAHLDLVGAYRPDMRESDDACIKRARVYVDTLAGASKEGGDIAQPLKSGILQQDDIRGDLFGLSSGTCAGREQGDAITLFKSVGTAIEDLAAAKFVYEKLREG